MFFSISFKHFNMNMKNIYIMSRRAQVRLYLGINLKPRYHKILASGEIDRKGDYSEDITI